MTDVRDLARPEFGLYVLMYGLWELKAYKTAKARDFWAAYYRRWYEVRIV